MTDNSAAFFAHTLASWFAACGRDLPWRHSPTPYQVWVSELMLQQTQVATVIPYYNKWMAQFPTVESLAQASLEAVNGLWAGLGYYRRARYLHQGASVVVDHYGGCFPSDISELQKITGIGAYTAGAIASFAFGMDVPAIDGNAERVISRYSGIYGDLSHGDPRRRIEDFAQHVVQIAGGAVINQAIMDLGATICRKKADCDKCPLQSQCYAYRNGLVEALPQKKAKSPKWLEYRSALLLESSDHRYLVAMPKSDALLGNLWVFPMQTIFREREDASDAKHRADASTRQSRKTLWQRMLSDLNPALTQVVPIPTELEIMHIFTHIRMHILVDIAKLTQPAQLLECAGGTYEKYAWLTRDQILTSPISTMMKKVVLRMPEIT